MSKIRQEDLAKAANVSIATVSLALRNHSSISPATKKRLMELQKELGYEPRKRKEGGARRQAPSILFCLLRRTFKNALYTPYLEGVVEASKRWKARLDLDFVSVDEPVSEHAFVMQNGNRPDGIIFAGEVTEEFLQMGERSADHVVVIGTHQFSRPVHRVDNDPYATAQTLVSRVLREGFSSAILLLLANNHYNLAYGSAILQAAREQSLSFPKENQLVINEFSEIREVAAKLARRKGSTMAVITPAAGVAQECINLLPAGAPRFSYYSVQAGALSFSTINCVDMGFQRLGQVAVERICHLVRKETLLHEPYVSLFPPIGWLN